MSDTETFSAYWDRIAAQVSAEDIEAEQADLVQHRDEDHDDYVDEQLPVYSKHDPNKSKEETCSHVIRDVSPSQGGRPWDHRVTPTEIATRIYGFGPGINSVDDTPRVDTPELRHTSIPNSTNQKRRRRNRKICCGIILALVVILVVGIATPVAVVKSRESHNGAPVPLTQNLTYRIAHHYHGNGFFDNFTFFTDTQEESFRNSFVNQTEALRLNLTSVLPDGNISMTIKDQSSVRIVSDETYSRGLFIFRIKDVPVGCDRTPTIRLSSSPGYLASNDITVFQTRGLTGDRYFGIRTNGSCMVNTYSRPTTITVDNICHNKASPDDTCRTDLTSFVHRPSSNPTTTRVVEVTNDFIRTWNYIPPSIDAQIDADNIDLNTWPAPYMTFPAWKCDMTRNFQNMHIVADIAQCGQYGYYDHSRSWRDGDWCEQECKLGSDPGSDRLNYNSTTWKWSDWKVFLPVNETTADRP